MRILFLAWLMVSSPLRSAQTVTFQSRRDLAGTGGALRGGHRRFPHGLALALYNRAAMFPFGAERTRLLLDAQDEDHKLFRADSRDKIALCGFGVCIWTRFYPEVKTALTGLGMIGGDPGPIRDEATRSKLRERFEPAMFEGIESMGMAASIDQVFVDGSTFLS